MAERDIEGTCLALKTIARTTMEKAREPEEAILLALGCIDLLCGAFIDLHRIAEAQTYIANSYTVPPRPSFNGMKAK